MRLQAMVGQGRTSRCSRPGRHDGVPWRDGSRPARRLNLGVSRFGLRYFETAVRRPVDASAFERRGVFPMAQWEYKTLTYGIEGKVVYSLRFWEDASRRTYGPKERGRLIGGIHQQMRQLEEALRQSDQE